MHNLKITARTLQFVVLSLGLMLFSDCKDDPSILCQTCTAKYNNGVQAGQKKVCSDAEETAFHTQYDYADLIVCQ
jgi:hypothetical protein